MFDPGLAVAEPVEHVEQLVSRDAPEAEQDPEAAVGGLGGQGPGGGELRGRVDEACDGGGQCEVALAAGLSVEDAGKTELGRQAEQGRHMPVWQRPSDGGGIVEGFKDNAALEESADGVDDGFGDFRKVGEGLSPDSFPLAPGFSEEDGRRAGAVGDDVDADGHGGTGYMATIIQAYIASTYVYVP